MRIPIRMIGMATTFLWIFLIAFLVTAVYSAKDLQFNFGQPRLEITADNKLLFSLPITIINKGFFNIDYFNITTKISDKDGFPITSGSTFMPVIRKGEEVTATHNVTADVNDLLQRDQNCLFNDTEVRINEMGSIRIAEIIPVQASTNFSMPWGAPLYNFTIGESQNTQINYTHVRVVVPISFENHAFFDLAGNIQIKMYNSSDVLVGEKQTSVKVWHNSPYNGYIELIVQTIGITTSGRFEVYVQTSFFDYGPMVILYG